MLSLHMVSTRSVHDTFQSPYGWSRKSLKRIRMYIRSTSQVEVFRSRIRQGIGTEKPPSGMLVEDGSAGYEPGKSGT